jgi:hypothetical protein
MRHGAWVCCEWLYVAWGERGVSPSQVNKDVLGIPSSSRWLLALMFAGELAIKCSNEELKPFVLQALERFAWILQVRCQCQTVAC